MIAIFFILRGHERPLPAGERVDNLDDAHAFDAGEPE
jgi:hypothetical protein